MVSVSHSSITTNSAKVFDPMDALAVAVRTELDRRTDGQSARLRNDGMLEVRAATPDASVSGSIHYDIEHLTEDRFLLKVSERGRVYVRSFPLWCVTPSKETRANLAGVRIIGAVESVGCGYSQNVDRAAATLGAGRRHRQATEIWMTLAAYYAQCVAAGITSSAS